MDREEVLMSTKDGNGNGGRHEINATLNLRFEKGRYDEATVDWIEEQAKPIVTRSVDTCWNKALDYGGGTVADSGDTGLTVQGEPIRFFCVVSAAPDGTVRLAYAYIGRSEWLQKMWEPIRHEMEQDRENSGYNQLLKSLRVVMRGVAEKDRAKVLVVMRMLAPPRECAVIDTYLRELEEEQNL
jgi:hypothetical protein